MRDIIIEPHITEKSVALSSKGKYIFKVNPRSTKNEIKKEIKRIFKVTAKTVDILYQRAKLKRRGRIVSRHPSFKKAIVTLKKGQKIKELEIKA